MIKYYLEIYCERDGKRVAISDPKFLMGFEKDDVTDHDLAMICQTAATEINDAYQAGIARESAARGIQVDRGPK